ncbi:hypothetical protein Esti_004127 [Eimeria stiedai]
MSHVGSPSERTRVTSSKAAAPARELEFPVGRRLRAHFLPSFCSSSNSSDSISDTRLGGCRCRLEERRGADGCDYAAGRSRSYISDSSLYLRGVNSAGILANCFFIGESSHPWIPRNCLKDSSEASLSQRTAMSLEACVVCVDSSAFARDADLHPTRLAAQLDATSLLANAKLNAHRENAVGIVTLGGDGARVSVAPTSEFGRIHSAFHEITAQGDADFVRGILVAQLALKHRINKTQRQRILLFVGSPVTATEKQLVQLGKQLKKNNIALDIVCLANVEENRAKLQAMHAAVNSNDTSRFVEYPSGSTNLLSDVMVSAMLLHDPEAAAASAAGAGGEGGADAAATAAAVNEFGVDPNVDPDLYMVLRMSLEEARQQQAQQQQQQRQAGAADASAATAQVSADAPAGAAQIEGLEDMDEELRQAVLLSLQDYCGDAAASANAEAAAQQAPSSETNTETAQQQQQQQAEGTTNPQSGQPQGDSAGGAEHGGN